MVVANAVAALQEIKDQGGGGGLELSPPLLLKLLRALNECTEWGQVRPPLPLTPLALSADKGPCRRTQEGGGGGALCHRACCSLPTSTKCIWRAFCETKSLIDRSSQIIDALSGSRQHGPQVPANKVSKHGNPKRITQIQNTCRPGG